MRIARELKALRKAVTQGMLANVNTLGLLDDDLCCWRLELHPPFNTDVPGGRLLNEDLARLEREAPGRGHILMEARFPDDYPTSPFFLRVVTPRIAMYRGHVTAGGSICIEMLTLSGGANAWRPELCVEAVLTQVITNMISAEEVFVKTATGPGSRAGPLRLDFSGGVHGCLREYSEAEAKQAFARTLENHRRLGWGSGPAPGAHAVGAQPVRGRATAPAAAGSLLHPLPPWATAAPAVAARAVGPLPLPWAAAPATAAAPSKPPAPAPAAAPGGRKRSVPAPAQASEVIELLESDEEEGGAIAAPPSNRSRLGAAPAKQQQQQQQMLLQAEDAIVDLTGEAAPAVAGAPAPPSSSAPAASWSHGKRRQAGGRARRGEAVRAQLAVPLPAAAPAEDAVPAPGIEARLAAANERTGLDLVRPPSHWKVTDALLEGRQEFVELPLPAGCGSPGAVATGAGALVVSEAHAAAVEELLANGVPQDEAEQALEAVDGDVDAALEWLLRQRSANAAAAPDEQAVAELRANRVSREDAVTALEHSGGDVQQARSTAWSAWTRAAQPRWRRARHAAQRRAQQARPRRRPPRRAGGRRRRCSTRQRRWSSALRHTMASRGSGLSRSSGTKT